MMMTTTQHEHERTLDPMTTGASVLAVKYAEGVMVMTDTLGSYGSLARFMAVPRQARIGDGVLLAASGELSDFQHIAETLEAEARRDRCADDGFRADARALWSVLQRTMYRRRGKIDPLWCGAVVAGRGGFLGSVDLYGTAFECDYCATGYGLYIALPLLRAAWRPAMPAEDARALLERCMRVLLFRDARTINRFQIGTATAAGVAISDPFELDTAGMWSAGELAIRDPK